MRTVLTTGNCWWWSSKCWWHLLITEICIFTALHSIQMSLR